MDTLNSTQETFDLANHGMNYIHGTYICATVGIHALESGSKPADTSYLQGCGEI